MDAAHPFTDVFEYLRAETAGAHRRLEQDLALLQPPLSKSRFIHALKTFLGFHAVWEPALRRHTGFAAILAGRSRVDQLTADLQALGVSLAEIAALPRIHAAAMLADTPQRALGSLYVMEGATLGGKVISRALRAAPWRPTHGLTFFDPYGDATLDMWRAFKDWGRDRAPAAAWPEIADSAVSTFETLHDAMSLGFVPAAIPAPEPALLHE